MKVNFINFLPLIYIYVLTTFFTIFLGDYLNLDLEQSISVFLGSFLIFFSVVKILRLKDFVEAFSEYDFISKNFKIYAYIFPFLELFFGIIFLLFIENIILEILCLVLFFVNLISVYLALQKKRKFLCACLADIIKLPLSYVSLIENLTLLLGTLFLLIN
jgi:hypothetical protein